MKSYVRLLNAYVRFLNAYADFSLASVRGGETANAPSCSSRVALSSSAPRAPAVYGLSDRIQLASVCRETHGGVSRRTDAHHKQPPVRASPPSHPASRPTPYFLQITLGCIITPPPPIILPTTPARVVAPPCQSLCPVGPETKRGS